MDYLFGQGVLQVILQSANFQSQVSIFVTRIVIRQSILFLNKTIFCFHIIILFLPFVDYTKDVKKNSLENVMFHGEMHDNIIMRKDKKKNCAAARSFWPQARFWDFFGLKKAEGLLKAKKIPKTGRRPK